MLRALLVITLGAAGADLPAPAVASGTQNPEPQEAAVLDLAAVRRLVSPLVSPAAGSSGDRAAAWTDVALVCEAVLGRTLERGLDAGALAAAFAAGRSQRLAVPPVVAARDATAYAMLSVGYSARETADVVSGRIGLEALDTARRMRAAGQGRERAADYLDGEYRRLADLRTRPAAPPIEPSGRPSEYDAFIERHARVHGVEPAVVHAIIEAESAYAPRAVSRAGAIGLMQLMPTTAVELGVNPYVPEQNIEGGIRYFASLLRTFGRLDLALVAYNGGPGYAQRYARGQAVLYGETRAYVRGVLARLGAGRPR